MINVTESAEPVVDIWDYIENLVKENVIDNYVYENKLVELVYRNDTSTFDHILFANSRQKCFYCGCRRLDERIHIRTFQIGLKRNIWTRQVNCATHNRDFALAEGGEYIFHLR